MRIERIIGGAVRGEPKLYKDRQYRCFSEGSNMDPEKPSTLEDVAKFFLANSRGGVRMTPNGSKIVEKIFIDGVPR